MLEEVSGTGMLWPYLIILQKKKIDYVHCPTVCPTVEDGPKAS